MIQFLGKICGLKVRGKRTGSKGIFSSHTGRHLLLVFLEEQLNVFTSWRCHQDLWEVVGWTGSLAKR